MCTIPPSSLEKTPSPSEAASCSLARTGGADPPPRWSPALNIRISGGMFRGRPPWGGGLPTGRAAGEGRGVMREGAVVTPVGAPILNWLAPGSPTVVMKASMWT